MTLSASSPLPICQMQKSLLQRASPRFRSGSSSRSLPTLSAIVSRT